MLTPKQLKVKGKLTLWWREIFALPHDDAANRERNILPADMGDPVIRRQAGEELPIGLRLEDAR